MKGVYTADYNSILAYKNRKKELTSNRITPEINHVEKETNKRVSKKKFIENDIFKINK